MFHFTHCSAAAITALSELHTCTLRAVAVLETGLFIRWCLTQISPVPTFIWIVFWPINDSINMSRDTAEAACNLLNLHNADPRTIHFGLSALCFLGHPNMGGPMQRMTPPRGMVPLGPQVGGGKEPTLTLLLFRHWQTQLKVCCCSPELRWWDETAAKRPGWPRDAWHEHVSNVSPQRRAELMILTCWALQNARTACFLS